MKSECRILKRHDLPDQELVCQQIVLAVTVKLNAPLTQTLSPSDGAREKNPRVAGPALSGDSTVNSMAVGTG